MSVLYDYMYMNFKSTEKLRFRIKGSGSSWGRENQLKRAHREVTCC
jgi:hypothetical protein